MLLLFLSARQFSIPEYKQNPYPRRSQPVVLSISITLSI